MKNILWDIFEIAINFYQGALAIWFIYKLLTPKSTKKAKIGGTVFAFAEGVIITTLNYISVFEGISSILYWISLFIFALFLFKDNIVKKVLSVTITQVIILLITSIELNVISSLFKITVTELVVKQNMLRFIALMIIQISILIMFMVTAKIFRYTDKYTFADWFAIIMALIISFALVAMIHILSLTAMPNERIYINLSYMLILIINVFIFYIIHSLFEKNQKLSDMEMRSLREQHMKQFVDNANSQYELIRKIRHDIKDQLSAVYILISKDETQEAMDFIAKSNDVINGVETFVRTDNAVANSIINSKLSAASALGIKVSCITVNDFTGISELDLCDLLSNTLENALTACKNMPTEVNRFIYLEIGKENDIYTFLVKNSIERSVLGENPKLQTTKLDKIDHGLGTKIIKDIAEKYNGRCDFYEADNMFCCQVVLMANGTDSNG